MNWNTFFTRTGTAIVFAIIMLAGLLGQTVLFMALFLFVQFLAVKEYFSLLHKINPNTEYSNTLTFTVQLFGALALIFTAPLLNTEKTLVPVLFCIPAFLLLWESLRAKGDINKVLHAFGALLYICLPLILLMMMREKSLLLPLGLILLIWINDTMAYIVGSFIGKTPFSSISPKKTWEGTIGGALLTIIAAGIWGAFSPYYSIQDWVVLSLCASVAGTLGDLFESKLKRLAGIKDSGNFMPGHGGALDRFDSLLLATPFAFCYSYLFMEPISIHIF
ncbi:MAG: phosphatidate cytidylyltransferase [Bacteroidota bacterium]